MRRSRTASPLPAGWREQVLEASHVVQDDDETTDRDVAEQRFDRFTALLDLVRGDEPDDVFRTLLHCLRPQEDYGSYERVLGRLAAFPLDRRGRLTADGLADLVEVNPDMAGAVLLDLARSGPRGRNSFGDRAAELPVDARRRIADFLAQQEQPGGWLDGCRGALRAGPDAGAIGT